MILKNYFKLLAVSMNNTTSNCPFTIVDMSGNEKTIQKPSNYYSNYLDAIGFIALSKQASTSNEKNSVIFGDGDVPVTIDDYKLSGNRITGISSTVNWSLLEDTDGMLISATFTITNNNESEITIKEVGCLGAWIGTHTSWNYASACLIERTVLDSPITIEPGGVGQLTYTIRMNYPTA